MKPRQVAYAIKELRGLTEDKKKELAVLVDVGLNFYEAQQNLKDFYILVNEIHHLYLWTFNVSNRVEVYKKLKATGIIDQFDRSKKSAYWPKRLLIMLIIWQITFVDIIYEI